jgi:hypothetical protein
MANVLTDLAADIYTAADTVGRELVGVIPSATINTNATEVAAQGEVIRAAFTQQQPVSTVTPSMTIPEGADQTVDNKTMTLSSTASVKIPWTGENIKFVNNGAGFDTIYGDQIKQAMRAITNQIETEVALDIGDRASRAVGTAGTTPFASNFNTVAEVRQVLVDNGMPSNDRQATLVINSAAGTKLRNLAQLNQVDSSGNDDMLRRGTLLDLQGIMMKESAGLDNHTAGTGSSATTDDAGYAVGATTLTLASAGTGTIVAGDVITFAGDTNQYVVTTGDGDVSGGGTIVLGANGLQVAIAASATAITVVASSVKNVAFHRSAVEIGIRGLAQPMGGDAAVDRMTVQDPMSGIVYNIAAYKGYNKAMFDISCLYGYKVWKPEFTAVLLG